MPLLFASPEKNKFSKSLNKQTLAYARTHRFHGLPRVFIRATQTRWSHYCKENILHVLQHLLWGFFHTYQPARKRPKGCTAMLVQSTSSTSRATTRHQTLPESLLGSPLCKCLVRRKVQIGRKFASTRIARLRTVTRHRDSGHPRAVGRPGSGA